MNAANLHLAINHFPVVTTILSALLLLWAWQRKNDELKKAGLAFVVLAAVFAAVAYFSGEPAEDVIKPLAFFSEDLVHEHEEAAEWAIIMSGISGVLAIATLYFFRTRRDLAAKTYIAVVILTLFSCTIYLRVAHLGGLIHHEEIRPPTAQ